MTTVKPLPLYGFSVLAEATVGYLFKSPLNLIWSSDSAFKLLQFLLVAARKEKGGENEILCFILLFGVK